MKNSSQQQTENDKEGDWGGKGVGEAREGQKKTACE